MAIAGEKGHRPQKLEDLVPPGLPEYAAMISSDGNSIIMPSIKFHINIALCTKRARLREFEKGMIKGMIYDIPADSPPAKLQKRWRRHERELESLLSLLHVSNQTYSLQKASYLEVMNTAKLIGCTIGAEAMEDFLNAPEHCHLFENLDGVIRTISSFIKYKLLPRRDSLVQSKWFTVLFGQSKLTDSKVEKLGGWITIASLQITFGLIGAAISLSILVLSLLRSSEARVVVTVVLGCFYPILFASVSDRVQNIPDLTLVSTTVTHIMVALISNDHAYSTSQATPTSIQSNRTLN